MTDTINSPLTAAAFIGASLDGFIAREDGDLAWLFEHGTTEGTGYEAFMADVDTLVIGRGTYETVLGFDDWPYGGTRVVVLSTGSPDVPDHLADRVEVASLDPPAVLDHLGATGAKRVYVDGGRTIQEFIRAGALDELIVTWVPVLIGSGRPLFGDVDRDVPVELVESKALPGGSVQAHYRLARAA